MRVIAKKPMAIARLKGQQNTADLVGTVRFYQLSGGVLVEAEVVGLPPNASGFYGFHVHGGGNCGGTDFATTGSHFDGNSSIHPLHSGDLPPLLSCNGKAYMVVQTDRFSLRDILGRTMVIHSNADDFTSQPAGNAGEKIACGIITKM